MQHGWISENAAIPKLFTRGLKSIARPRFNRQDINLLLEYMQTWQHKGRLAVEHEMRQLLRDYVEILLYKGIRHGTKALGLSWCDVGWHQADGRRHLRLWVDEKTGGSWLIAKHATIEAFKRLHAKQPAITSIDFEKIEWYIWAVDARLWIIEKLRWANVKALCATPYVCNFGITEKKH